MNNQLVRVGLPVVAVVGLIFGITYVSQVAPNTGRPKIAGTAKPQAGPALIVPNDKASWDPDEPPDLPVGLRFAKEMEQGTEGHYDFWVANVNAVPATTTLKYKSCKCANVQLGVVESGAAASFLAGHRSQSEGPLDRNAIEKLLVAAKADENLNKHIEWKPYTELEASLQVPKADETTGIRLAVVRLQFHPQDMGNLLVVADISYVGDGKPAQSKFEVPIAIVPKVQIYPDNFNVGEIRSGDTRQVDFLLWSATRDSFPYKQPDLPEDPTFVFGTVEPLNTAGIIKELQRMKAKRQGTKPLTGYKVSLTIHENLNDKLLELGPLARRLTFNAGTEYEAVSEIRGVVRGDVRLMDTNGTDADKIKLGDFEAGRPTTKVYNLQTMSPGTKLRVLSRVPEVLKVELKERPATPMLWELKVEVAANTMAGPLPYGSSITLETVGPKSRRVRVPVEGTAMIR